MSTPVYFMQQALLAGRLALPGCLPNPPVGCVLVKDRQIVGQGFTQRPGEPHAEAMALAQWPGDCSGLTAYVTLEPCSFQGRTPSCARTLGQRGVGRVVVAMLDPDPRNAGAGVQILRQAGIEVQVGLLAEEAAQDLSAYLLASGY
ncbi:bifunctional diaminohydroxyphosphoribosylaminopyrimidine deaminase/5-amino-6-(5-phosphoribosylamino)uracil reductase RibD [Pseudomonas sp. LD120]|uniref:bifunctional diaminohydroxyphosphoribosylaminopyrimidine deaminase/5-amino-6-(5-phosphoribosylamino)uracil reductase RibD n=1 Tax=Pseudomonas sp. LD120 TaxID=485751 RepID=UPI00135A9843|nr:bifunctional diaminohydroxyphosphoribosylaminopyrimidine deaminase/5-amino-6-(5-phosphoribosylamino)uracil reductase RibD [Pseudomonas sp. LD120]KAF0864431.1 riboflavin-specific deaminase [Pseudomonas sp. LD120]